MHKELPHAESRGILTPLQFGFRSKVSAQDAILYFIETIQHEIEIGKIVHAVLLDHLIIRKPLTRFHTKFYSRNSSRYIFHFQLHKSWNFLTGRLQQIIVNGVLSEWIELKQGVAQGTVKGPLFFNLYVNDLPELLNKPAHILHYADDYLVFCSDKKSEITLEDNIDKL